MNLLILLKISTILNASRSQYSSSLCYFCTVCIQCLTTRLQDVKFCTRSLHIAHWDASFLLSSGVLLASSRISLPSSLGMVHFFNKIPLLNESPHLTQNQRHS